MSVNEREHKAAAAVDAREAGGARVTDPALIPSTPPAAVSRGMMAALADRLELEALLHARAMVAAVETAIRELRAGRYEGCLFAMIDIETAATRLNEATNAAGGPVHKAITSLDPAYTKALEPVTDETSILRRLNMIDPNASAPSLKLALALHTNCPNCYDAEALKRAIAAKEKG